PTGERGTPVLGAELGVELGVGEGLEEVELRGGLLGAGGAVDGRIRQRDAGPVEIGRGPEGSALPDGSGERGALAAELLVERDGVGPLLGPVVAEVAPRCVAVERAPDARALGGVAEPIAAVDPVTVGARELEV